MNTSTTRKRSSVSSVNCRTSSEVQPRHLRWVDGVVPTEKVVTEQVTIVYAYCTTEQSVEHADRVVDIARRIAREYKQEPVTVEYNNQVAFVGAE